MRPTTVDMLAVFPSLATGCVGGVQTSGRVAWSAIEDAWHRRDGHGAAQLFECGGALTGASASSTSWAGRGGAKLAAILRVTGARWSARTVLVWHLGLLKLLPFFRLPGARIVVFLHGIEAWRRQDLVTRRLLPRVDLFLSNSEHTWRKFAAWHPQLREATHRVVPLGLGEPTARAPRRPASPPAALMLGRLARGEEYKGHRELIAAWGEVSRQMPEAELWIAGDGDLRPELERWTSSLKHGSRVRFCGRVTEPEKERLLTEARCLVLPSQGEGFGLVYVEAMRLGRPCLVSTVDAGREVVNPPECGLAVDPHQPAAIGTAVGRLLTDGPEWERWSRQARERYESQFTAARFRGRLLEALALAGVSASVARA